MATLRASNQTQLNAAVKLLNTGDTLLLSPGTYAKLSLAKTWDKSYDFAQKVTITSADASNPAVIREVFVRDASNIELKALKFDYNGSQPNAPDWLRGRPFYVENASKITIDNVVFDGHLSGGFGQGRGLRVKESDQIVVRNSEFLNFHDGMDFMNVDDVQITGNEFRGMGNDGMTLGGMHNVRIEANEFRDFKAADPGENHKDGIQFRSGPTEGPSSDVVIRNNTMNISEVVHAIWMGNELHRDGDWNNKHTNVLIENNYIRTAHKHGITVYHGDDVTIRNNTLVQNPDKGYTDIVNIPLINVSKFSTDVEIRGNTVRSVQSEQNSTWTVTGNTTRSNLPHWDGDYRSGVRPPATPSNTDTDTDIEITGVFETSYDADVFRIDARRMDGDTTFDVDGLNFASDDALILSMFDAGTFVNAGTRNVVSIWDNDRAVKIDSVLDIRELVANNPSDIRASVSGDNLVVRIDYGDDVAEILLDGLGNEYAAANRPDLF